MATSTHTIKIDPDTAEAEASLERLVALAKRFKELWGDAPTPDGIERFTIAEGDRVLFRYDKPLSDAHVDAIGAQIKRALPEIEPLVLSGGLRLEGVLATGGPVFDAAAAPEMGGDPPPADSEIRG